MAYRYHPEIEGLKCNADGSEVLFNGKLLKQREMPQKNKKTSMIYVIVRSKAFSIAKLVCECWNGMAANPRWCALRKDRNKGYHYTNLFFAPCGTQIKNNFLPSEKDKKLIKKRLENGDTLKAIAMDYNTTDMTILRLKKKLFK
jgi:hypothetical protein